MPRTPAAPCSRRDALKRRRVVSYGKDTWGGVSEAFPTLNKMFHYEKLSLRT
jgi:hypothetical protein